MEIAKGHNQLSNPMLNILKRLFKIIPLIQKVQKSIIHLSHKKPGPIAGTDLVLSMLSMPCHGNGHPHGSGDAWPCTPWIQITKLSIAQGTHRKSPCLERVVTGVPGLVAVAEVDGPGIRGRTSSFP